MVRPRHLASVLGLATALLLVLVWLLNRKPHDAIAASPVSPPPPQWSERQQSVPRPQEGYLAELSWLMALVEHGGTPTHQQLECGSTAAMPKNLDEGFSVCAVVQPSAEESITAGMPFSVTLKCPDRHCGGAFDIELRGPSVTAVRTIDDGAGLYSATVILYDAGNYTMHINLAYSGFVWARKPCGPRGVCSEGRQPAAEKLEGVTWERLPVHSLHVLPVPVEQALPICPAGDGAAVGRWVGGRAGQTGEVHVSWKDHLEWRPSRCRLLEYSKQSAAECFKRRKRTHVVLIGDSQMRSFYNCWLDFVLGQLPQSKASKAQFRGKAGQGKAALAAVSAWLNTTFIQETSGVGVVIDRAVSAARDRDTVVFSNAGQHDVTYRHVFGPNGGFKATVDSKVKIALQEHHARTDKGQLYWVSTAAQNPWPIVGSTSLERQMVAEHLIQAVGTGLWDGVLDLMGLTVGRRDVLQDYFWDERHYGHEVQWMTAHGVEHHFVSAVHFVQVQVALNMMCN